MSTSTPRHPSNPAGELATPTTPLHVREGGNTDRNLSLSERVKRFHACQINMPSTPFTLDSENLISDDSAASEADATEPVIGRKRQRGDLTSDSDTWDSDLPVNVRRAKIEHCLSLVKSKISIPAEIEAEVQAWAEADQFERAGLLYTHFSLLRHTLHQSQSAKPQIYVIPQELNINIQAYVWKLGLSPYLKKYKNSWAPIVMAAMREARVDQLPPATNEGQIATITSKVNEIATKVRFYLKETLELSIGLNRKNKASAGGPKMHITTLARTLSTKYSIEITVELLQRLAVLRSICFSYYQQSEKETDFWIHVDKQLVKYASQNSKSADYKAWLGTVLTIDMDDYPRTDGLQGYQDIIARYEKVPEAQRIIDKHARSTV